MSNWIGSWNVEQSSMVGTFKMDMIVTENGDTVDVEFVSPQVVCTLSDIVADGDKLTMMIQLVKPIKGKSDAELTLEGADAFSGTGKMKFLPASKFKGVRKS